MDVMKPQLQALLVRARAWTDRIKKTTLSESVSFTSDAPTGEFSITVKWTTNGGVPGTYTKRFTRDLVFGEAARRGTNPTIRRTLCSFMREFMQEVIHSRGV